MEPEALYLQLNQLIAEMPTLGGTGPITPEINRWLGRAALLVTEVGNGRDPVTITVATDGLNAPGALRELYAQQIQAVLFRALAFAEEKAPTAARGGFIGIRQDLDALQAISRWRRCAQRCCDGFNSLVRLVRLRYGSQLPALFTTA
jgi:hypothetical protein